MKCHVNLLLNCEDVCILKMFKKCKKKTLVADFFGLTVFGEIFRKIFGGILRKIDYIAYEHH